MKEEASTVPSAARSAQCAAQWKRNGKGILTCDIDVFDIRLTDPTYWPHHHTSMPLHFQWPGPVLSARQLPRRPVFDLYC